MEKRILFWIFSCLVGAISAHFFGLPWGIMVAVAVVIFTGLLILPIS